MNEIKSLCRAYSSIFFIDNIILGACLMFATLLYPNIGFSGLFALIFARLFSKTMKIHFSATYSQSIMYNSLLVGVFLGHMYVFSLLSLLLIAIVIILTIIFTIVLDHFFKGYELPILSLPFAVIAILLALVNTQFNGLRDATPYFIERGAFLEAYFPVNILIFLRSLGSIFCITDALFGGVIFLMVLFGSPLMALFLFAGFFLGYEAEMLFKSYTPPAMDSHFFNYSLIFASLATVFLFPNIKSLITASIGTVIASLVVIASLTFWNVHQVPITSMPFNIMVIMILRTLKSVNPALLFYGYCKNPEETIDRSRMYRLRHASGEIGVFCPFEGTWAIQQSFDGEWTHRGPWKHALDFVKLGEDQKTFKERGFELTDYHAFAEPVLSPMNGYVIATLSTLVDNRIGSVDNQNNWGNYIIIRSYGIYAVLAHLKKDSIIVAIGDYVSAGQKIAECGNTGYSKEPHLHLQIQYSYFLGAYTAPFHLLNYEQKETIHFHRTPKLNEVVSPLLKNGELDKALSFKIGEFLEFNLKTDGQVIKVIKIQTLLDEITGAMYLSDNAGTKLYFSKIGIQFYFYGFEGSRTSILADLFLAAPKIPLSYGGSFDYQDYLPLFLTENFLGRWLKVARTLFSPAENYWAGTYHFNSNLLEITGNNFSKGHRTKTFLSLDPVLGIMKFIIQDRSYERIR